MPKKFYSSILISSFIGLTALAAAATTLFASPADRDVPAVLSIRERAALTLQITQKRLYALPPQMLPEAGFPRRGGCGLGHEEKGRPVGLSRADRPRARSKEDRDQRGRDPVGGRRPDGSPE